jgi:hypothetical protein
MGIEIQFKNLYSMGWTEVIAILLGKKPVLVPIPKPNKQIKN